MYEWECKIFNGMYIGLKMVSYFLNSEHVTDVDEHWMWCLCFVCFGCCPHCWLHPQVRLARLQDTLTLFLSFPFLNFLIFRSHLFVSVPHLFIFRIWIVVVCALVANFREMCLSVRVCLNVWMCVAWKTRIFHMTADRRFVRKKRFRNEVCI